MARSFHLKNGIRGQVARGSFVMFHRALTFFRRAPKKKPLTRPARCPSCLSDQTAQTISSSPEVYSFVCFDCKHEWSQLIRTPMPHWTDPVG